jgi:hypothetical protein
MITWPSDFSTTIECPSTFTFITASSSSAITVPHKCQSYLKSLTPNQSQLLHIHTSKPFTTKGHENLMSYFQHITLLNLKPLSSISEIWSILIDNINATVATAVANSKIANKTVEEYFQRPWKHQTKWN